MMMVTVTQRLAVFYYCIWFANTLLKEHMIDETHLGLFSFAETPQQILEQIQNFYHK